MKILGFLFGFIILIISSAILYFGYLGFVPFLSDLMGANKPKDLGVKYSIKESQLFSNKIGNQIIETTETAAPGKSVEYFGKREVNESFSQEEISARINYGRWKYMPVGNTQIRINPDGYVEFSGNILIDRLPGFISQVGLGKYSMSDVTKGLDFINLIKVNPPLYAKLKTSMTDNKINLNISTITVGKFTVPLESIQANETINAVAQTILTQATGFYGKSVTFSDGKMKFVGSIPEKMKIEVVK